MNFKFNIKGFEVKMKGEGHVSVEGIEVEYTDVKLSEIPAIIKEVRKAVVDFSEIAKSPTYSSEEYPYPTDEEGSSTDPILSAQSEDEPDEIDFDDEEEDDEDEDESLPDTREHDYDVKPQKPKKKGKRGTTDNVDDTDDNMF